MARRAKAFRAAIGIEAAIAFGHTDICCHTRFCQAACASLVVWAIRVVEAVVVSARAHAGKRALVKATTVGAIGAIGVLRAGDGNPSVHTIVIWQPTGATLSRASRASGAVIRRGARHAAVSVAR